jgi:hypothetical protein
MVPPFGAERRGIAEQRESVGLGHDAAQRFHSPRAAAEFARNELPTGASL